MNLLLIDNYDSFTYNLVQLIRKVNPTIEVIVRRNDQLRLGEPAELDASAIVISPGPGRPQNAGICCDVIRRFGEETAILGICLGHQCLVEAFGGKTISARELIHGKTSAVHHDGEGLFKGLESPLEAARYHSLAADKSSLPPCLVVDAWTADGEIMGIRHRQLPLYGIQFHPESFLTPCGHRLMSNFLEAQKV